VLPSLIIPAIAPATDAGEDFDETFKQSIDSFKCSILNLY
jgi:hypothetical protein